MLRLAISILFVSTLELTQSDNSIYDTSITSVPRSCVGLDTGYHWIRPLTGSKDGVEYPNIYVYCQDDFTILDPSLVPLESTQHIKAYFTTYSDITDDIASSSLNDHVTWREWFTVAGDETQFRLSPDCQTCTASKTDGVYYMTGNYNGCLWISKGYCDMDSNTMECFTCSTKSVSVDDTGEPLSGLCTHMETLADRAVNSQHSECVGTQYNVEPSIGTSGSFCQCYRQPGAKLEMVPAAAWDVDTKMSTGSHRTIDTLVSLYASDFSDGSYRITQPGTYVIMEDIAFNMNAGSLHDPNAEGAWYPRVEQADEYEGADGSFVGAYSMGFFAGLVVESDDVIIDLNGFTLQMSEIFQLQQRWFNLIELGSKAFISGQGPGNFGPYMTSPSNVLIKGPGVLGRTSHHAIHGNDINQVTIRDLNIEHFEVAGIAINGFVGLTIENVNIGPINQNVPVMGVYTQARLLLPRLRSVLDTEPNAQVQIRGETRTLENIVHELQAQMDIMVDHYINGVEYEEMDDQERVTMARALFENVNQLPSASTAYGIFLNSYGASVFSISGSPGYSETAVLKNIHIHGIYKAPWEVPRVPLTKGPFNDIMDLTRATDNGLTTSDSKYLGNVYTDAQYAIHATTEWSILGHAVVSDRIANWVETGDAITGENKMICNGDIMLHVTKGIFGLRVDSVNNIKIENVHVSDLQNIGEFGSTMCGGYESTDDGGHRNQNFPLQRGYTGTEVHAVSFVASTGTVNGLKVDNIVSARGDAMAVQFFPSNSFSLKNVQIENIHAGAYLAEGDIDTGHYLPNKVPRACAIDVWSYTSEKDGFTANKISAENVQAKCLTTYWACSRSDYDAEFDGSVLQDCDKEDGTEETSVFEAFVAPQSEVHGKLFGILRRQKPFKPLVERPELRKTGWWMLVVVTAMFLLFIAWKLSYKSDKVRFVYKRLPFLMGGQTQNELDEDNKYSEYERLLDSDQSVYNKELIQQLIN